MFKILCVFRHFGNGGNSVHSQVIEFDSSTLADVAYDKLQKQFEGGTYLVATITKLYY